MNPTKGSESAVAQVTAVTGRDGAVDFAANKEALNQDNKEALDQDPEAHSEHHIYRVIELVGTSKDSIEDAINTAIVRADKTLRNLRWFEVAKTSGHIESGKVRH